MDFPSYICGEAVHTGDKLEVRYPWDNSVTGTAAQVGAAHLERAIATAITGRRNPLTRHERFTILRRAAELVSANREELAALICRESGLCIRDTRYETGRTSDVLEFAAQEAMRDDGQIFSCDISPQGKARKVFTTRRAVRLVAAITPFNHPLNQVVHKVAPAIAAGAPMILKPSEKTPLTALRFTELLYEAGLPGWMLSTILGPIDSVVTPLVTDERVELVSFTGSVAIAYYNVGPFALSTGVVTTNLGLAMQACRDLDSGTTNVNEVPGYRLEMTPFGGTKDSGLGIKEGVGEATKFMTNTKTFSLPW